MFVPDDADASVTGVTVRTSGKLERKAALSTGGAAGVELAQARGALSPGEDLSRLQLTYIPDGLGIKCRALLKF